MRIITEEQGTEEWLLARVGLVTASQASRVVSKNILDFSETQLRYIDELVAEVLSGEPAYVPETYAMKRGKELEPIARARYESFTGFHVKQTGLIMHEHHDDFGCSVDGYVEGSHLIEIKCPNNPANHAALIRDETRFDRKYWWQMQAQMAVTGYTKCDFVSYHPGFENTGTDILVSQQEMDPIARSRFINCALRIATKVREITDPYLLKI
jgi:putative phage-type endonuclease